MDSHSCDRGSNLGNHIPGLGSSTVDQVLKYTKYLKYIPSTSTFISSTSTSTHIKIFHWSLISIPLYIYNVCSVDKRKGLFLNSKVRMDRHNV